MTITNKNTVKAAYVKPDSRTLCQFTCVQKPRMRQPFVCCSVYCLVQAAIRHYGFDRENKSAEKSSGDRGDHGPVTKIVVFDHLGSAHTEQPSKHRPIVRY